MECRPDLGRRRAAAHPEGAVGVGWHGRGRGSPQAMPLPSLVLRGTGGSTSASDAGGPNRWAPPAVNSHPIDVVV
eukprot:11205485-Lingulodinium_polyedra.AAC.1